MEIKFNMRYPNTVPKVHATVLQFYSKEFTYNDLNGMISYCLNKKILPSTHNIDRGEKLLCKSVAISCYCL